MRVRVFDTLGFRIRKHFRYTRLALKAGCQPHIEGDVGLLFTGAINKIVGTEQYSVPFFDASGILPQIAGS